MDTKKIESADPDTLRYFLWSVQAFFSQVTRIEPEVGSPYLFDGLCHGDYTGIIGVSGSQKGAVYFSAKKETVDEILQMGFSYALDDTLSEEQMEAMRIDLVGEIANIISGNVRNYAGEQFLISVPVVVSSPGNQIKLSNPLVSVIFPINWQGNSCHLVLSIEPGDAPKKDGLTMPALEAV